MTFSARCVRLLLPGLHQNSLIAGRATESARLRVLLDHIVAKVLNPIGVACLVHTSKGEIRFWWFARTIINISLKTKVRRIHVCAAAFRIMFVIQAYGFLDKIIYVVDDGLGNVRKVDLVDDEEDRVAGPVHGYQLVFQPICPRVHRIVARSKTSIRCIDGFVKSLLLLVYDKTY